MSTQKPHVYYNADGNFISITFSEKGLPFRLYSTNGTEIPVIVKQSGATTIVTPVTYFPGIVLVHFLSKEFNGTVKVGVGKL